MHKLVSSGIRCCNMIYIYIYMVLCCCFMASVVQSAAIWNSITYSEKHVANLSIFVCSLILQMMSQFILSEIASEINH